MVLMTDDDDDDLLCQPVKANLFGLIDLL